MLCSSAAVTLFAVLVRVRVVRVRVEIVVMVEMVAMVVMVVVLSVVAAAAALAAVAVVVMVTALARGAAGGSGCRGAESMRNSINHPVGRHPSPSPPPAFSSLLPLGASFSPAAQPLPKSHSPALPSSPHPTLIFSDPIQ